MNEVYQDLAAAIKRRDHAMNMLNRWQQVVADTEQEIQKLSGALSADTAAAEPDAAFAELVQDGQAYEQL